MRVVFDLDGTLCNIEHRLHFIQGPKKDWPAFLRACVDDKPIWNLIKVCRLMSFNEDHVEVWSGRSEDVRIETVNWLSRHGLGIIDGLRMRKSGDYRQDCIVKGEWLDALPENERPDIVFDDRQQVVDMWRSRGILCCQVAPGDF